MGSEEIKNKLIELQKEYTQACGVGGHLMTQIKDLQNQLSENEATRLSIAKKATNLSNQLPKEEVKAEEKKDGETVNAA